jgi:hypothetical protein
MKSGDATYFSLYLRPRNRASDCAGRREIIIMAGSRRSPAEMDMRDYSLKRIFFAGLLVLGLAMTSENSSSLFPGRRRIAALGVEITRNCSTGQVT